MSKRSVVTRRVFCLIVNSRKEDEMLLSAGHTHCLINSLMQKNPLTMLETDSLENGLICTL